MRVQADDGVSTRVCAALRTAPAHAAMPPPPEHTAASPHAAGLRWLPTGASPPHRFHSTRPDRAWCKARSPKQTICKIPGSSSALLRAILVYLSVAPYPLCIRCPRWPAALVNTLSTVTSPPAVACLNTTIKPTDQPTLTGSPSDGGLGNDTFIVKRFHTEFDLTVEFTYEVQRRLGDHCPSVQRPVAYCPNGNHVHRHNPAGILGLGLSLAGAFLSPRFMRIVPHRVPCWC